MSDFVVSNPPADRTQEFVALLLRAEPQIYAFLRAQVLDRNDAEDLFQETAAVLWQKFDQFEPGTNFAAWACQVARNKVLHFHRTQQRQRSLFGPELLDLIAQKSQDLSSEVVDMKRALEDCIQRLRPGDRRILRRSLARDVTVRMLAGEFGRPLETIKTVLKRSRRALLDCVQNTVARESR